MQARSKLVAMVGRSSFACTLLVMHLCGVMGVRPPRMGAANQPLQPLLLQPVCHPRRLPLRRSSFPSGRLSTPHPPRFCR